MQNYPFASVVTLQEPWHGHQPEIITPKTWCKQDKELSEQYTGRRQPQVLLAPVIRYNLGWNTTASLGGKCQPPQNPTEQFLLYFCMKNNGKFTLELHKFSCSKCFRSLAKGSEKPHHLNTEKTTQYRFILGFMILLFNTSKRKMKRYQDLQRHWMIHVTGKGTGEEPQCPKAVNSSTATAKFVPVQGPPIPVAAVCSQAQSLQRVNVCVNV